MPRLDEAALERLGHVLDREGVIAAMLIAGDEVDVVMLNHVPPSRYPRR